LDGGRTWVAFGLLLSFRSNAIPLSGILQIVAFIGFLELFVMKDIEGTGNEFVGDFRNGYIDFGWKKFDAETKLKKRAIELNQGRAAQMGLFVLTDGP
jgi:Chlorophyll A-B binding protein